MKQFQKSLLAGALLSLFSLSLLGQSFAATVTTTMQASVGGNLTITDMSGIGALAAIGAPDAALTDGNLINRFNLNYLIRNNDPVPRTKITTSATPAAGSTTLSFVDLTNGTNTIAAVFSDADTVTTNGTATGTLFGTDGNNLVVAGNTNNFWLATQPDITWGASAPAGSAATTGPLSAGTYTGTLTVTAVNAP